jgi:hypothetical protein
MGIVFCCMRGSRHVAAHQLSGHACPARHHAVSLSAWFCVIAHLPLVNRHDAQLHERRVDSLFAGGALMLASWAKGLSQGLLPERAIGKLCGRGHAAAPGH